MYIRSFLMYIRKLLTNNRWLLTKIAQMLFEWFEEVRIGFEWFELGSHYLVFCAETNILFSYLFTIQIQF